MSFGIFVPGDLRFGRTKRQRRARRARRRQRNHAAEWSYLRADLDALRAEWQEAFPRWEDRPPAPDREGGIPLPTPSNLKGDNR